MKVPRFPLLGEPGEWSELELLAATVFLEAEAEPSEGQVAVAWVIRSRVDQWGRTFKQTILGLDARAYDDEKPFEAFSCWNDDYRARARARLVAAEDHAESAWRAAAGAYWRLLSNPTKEALFYLQPELTKRIRGGTLPAWAADPGDATKLNQDKLVAMIGRHVFLRA